MFGHRSFFVARFAKPALFSIRFPALVTKLRTVVEVVAAVQWTIDMPPAFAVVIFDWPPLIVPAPNKGSGNTFVIFLVIVPHSVKFLGQKMSHPQCMRYLDYIFEFLVVLLAFGDIMVYGKSVFLAISPGNDACLPIAMSSSFRFLSNSALASTMLFNSCPSITFETP